MRQLLSSFAFNYISRPFSLEYLEDSLDDWLAEALQGYGEVGLCRQGLNPVLECLV
jgi:hypothetical protein